MPEAGEKHQEETELREQKGGPDAGLREHVHRGPSGEDDGGESENSEEEEDRPRLEEVSAESSPSRCEGTTNAAVGFAIGAEVEAKLDGVDLDQIEVEAEAGGDEEDDDVAGEDAEEGRTSDDVLVNVLGP